MFGILFTQAVTEHRLIPGSPEIPNLEESYGTVVRSVYTLFKAISGGVSWGEVVWPLGLLHPGWMTCFLIYFSFTYFAVLNVVTGVFCNTAIESASYDQDMATHAQLQAKEYYVKQLTALFKQIDTDRTGSITLSEFENGIKDEKLNAYFASLGLSVDEAFSLFKLLDRHHMQVLDIDTFVTGCLKLRGQAKSVEIAMAMYETRWTLQKCLGAIKAVNDRLTEFQTSGIPAKGVNMAAAYYEYDEIGSETSEQSAEGAAHAEGAGYLTHSGDVKQTRI